MSTEETREQQQMYNLFRSAIYVFLIIELVMNLPYHATNRVVAFILDLVYRFQIFNSVLSCKVFELVCVAVTCIGTKAKKSLKFNIRTMVLYPIIASQEYAAAKKYVALVNTFPDVESVMNDETRHGDLVNGLLK